LRQAYDYWQDQPGNYFNRNFNPEDEACLIPTEQYST